MKSRLFRLRIEKDKVFVDGEAISLKLAAKIFAESNCCIYSMTGLEKDINEFVNLIDKLEK